MLKVKKKKIAEEEIVAETVQHQVLGFGAAGNFFLVYFQLQNKKKIPQNR